MVRFTHPTGAEFHRRRNAAAEDLAMGLCERAKIVAEKAVQAGRRIESEPFLRQALDMGFVAALRAAMGIAAAGESPQIAVESWTDMPQLVNHRGEFLAKTEIEKPRQIEGQDVEHSRPDSSISRWMIHFRPRRMVSRFRHGIARA